MVRPRNGSTAPSCCCCSAPQLEQNRPAPPGAPQATQALIGRRPSILDQCMQSYTSSANCGERIPRPSKLDLQQSNGCAGARYCSAARDLRSLSTCLSDSNTMSDHMIQKSDTSAPRAADPHPNHI